MNVTEQLVSNTRETKEPDRGPGVGDTGMETGEEKTKTRSLRTERL